MQRTRRGRTTALAVTLAAGLASCLLAAVQPALAESEPDAAVSASSDGQVRTVEGVIRLLAADTVSHVEEGEEDHEHDHDFTGPSEDDYRQVLVVGGSSYLLEGVQGQANTVARVTGASDGTTFTASTVQTLGAATGSIPSKGTTRVLVLLAHWSQPDSVTQQQAQTQLFSDTNGWYRDASYTELGQTGDVTPWMKIDGPVDGKCYADSGNIMTQAKTAAAALGYDLGSYQNFVMYFPNNGWQEGSDCDGFAGWAYVGAPNTWLNGYLDRRATVHEQGHNYGLVHSHSYLCSDVIEGTCTFSDYGDDYDAMGSSGYVGHFSASQKQLLDWLDHRLVDLTYGGHATLAPYAGDDVVSDAAVVYASATRSYWLEYRQRVDYDAGLPTGATNGVLLHVKDQTISGDNGSSLLDTRPEDGLAPSTSTLRSGESWTSPEGFTLSVGAVTPTGAKVSVTGGPVCPDSSREPDDDATQAREVGLPSTTKHSFCSPGDQDWVEVEATAGLPYRFRTLHLSRGNDTVLDLYAGDGTTLIDSNDDHGRAGPSLIKFTPETTGTYYVAARAFGAKSGVDLTYRLKLTQR